MMCASIAVKTHVRNLQIHGAQAALRKMLPLMFSREQGTALPSCVALDSMQSKT